MKTEDVLEVVLRIAQSIKYRGLMLNERYLHHFFSHLMQDKHGLLNLARDNYTIILHPEWPTYKKQTGLLYGRYKKENSKYTPNTRGTAGFIDFTIGNYDKPDIGIEFSLKYGWSHEEIVYDFVKLLDKKNPFKTSISFNLIFRLKKLVKGKFLTNLEEHMNNAVSEAVNRLNGGLDKSRELYFIITEIDKYNSKRHWHLHKTSNNFKPGLEFSSLDESNI